MVEWMKGLLPTAMLFWLAAVPGCMTELGGTGDEVVVAPAPLVVGGGQAPLAPPDGGTSGTSVETLWRQTAMDRTSKLMTTISNVAKKQDDVDAGILNNVK